MHARLHLRAPGLSRAQGEACKARPHANITWLKSREAKNGDHVCEQYELICLDQGSLVVYDPAYNMVNGSALPTFELSDLGVRPAQNTISCLPCPCL